MANNNLPFNAKENQASTEIATSIGTCEVIYWQVEDGYNFHVATSNYAGLVTSGVDSADTVLDEAKSIVESHAAKNRRWQDWQEYGEKQQQ
jgi:hypothetical protein